MLTVTVMNVVGLFRANRCGMATLAITNGAVKFVVISETIKSVLTADVLVKSPSSIFPAQTKMLSRSGKDLKILFKLDSMDEISEISI